MDHKIIKHLREGRLSLLLDQSGQIDHVPLGREAKLLPVGDRLDVGLNILSFFEPAVTPMIQWALDEAARIGFSRLAIHNGDSGSQKSNYGENGSKEIVELRLTAYSSEAPVNKARPRIHIEITQTIIFAHDDNEISTVLGHVELQSALDLTRSRIERDDGKAAIILFTLHRYKMIREMIGRSESNDLVQHVLRFLKTTAVKGDYVVNLGPNWFGLMKGRVASASSLMIEIRSILKEFSNLSLPVGNSSFHFLCSAGIRCFSSEDTETTDQLIHQAGIALVDASENRRGSAVLYDHVIGSSLADRIGRETRLLHIIRHRTLEVNYQPIIDLETGNLVALEALSRFRDPETGETSPTFPMIEAAEACGAIEQVTDQVFGIVVEQMRDWTLRDAIPKDMRLCVNLSSHQLHRFDLIDKLERVLLSVGRERNDWLELEITESALVRDPKLAAHTIKRIRNIGIRMAIDDFGTGYSSFSNVQRFMPDVLKIDGSFVKNMIDDQMNRDIIEVIVHIAQRSGIETVGEWVEDVDQSRALARMGCTLGQGYYFSPAMSQGATNEYLEKLHVSSNSATGATI